MNRLLMTRAMNYAALRFILVYLFQITSNTSAKDSMPISSRSQLFSGKLWTEDWRMDQWWFYPHSEYYRQVWIPVIIALHSSFRDLTGLTDTTVRDRIRHTILNYSVEWYIHEWRLHTYWLLICTLNFVVCEICECHLHCKLDFYAMQLLSERDHRSLKFIWARYRTVRPTVPSALCDVLLENPFVSWQFIT